ncbi:hypothetical protein [Streptomyces tremellae]|uniref:Thiopeptide-type bacteriocin biosynthesis domain-containing protein n=1 Tax=Streptomyces tremellae TaxID=1124239 RepID=A0ABP7FIA6_9ACTN
MAEYEGGTGTAVPPPEDRDPMAVLALPDDLRFPGTPAEVEYEAYFRIGRARPEPDLWTRALLRTQAAFLADLPATGLGDRERADLLAGFVLLGHTALAAAPPPAEPADEEPYLPPSSGGMPPLGRWRLGHQIFHLLLALMNSLLDEALRAADAAEWLRVTGLLDRLRLLYDAATAAMSYAADFGDDPLGAYRREVRPTMEPPFVSPGFSGTFNREHRETTRLLRQLRRALKAAAPDDHELRTAADALRAAQSRNRANHLLICERCVPEGVSLLREHLTAQRPPDPTTPPDA